MKSAGLSHDNKRAAGVLREHVGRGKGKGARSKSRKSE